MDLPWGDKRVTQFVTNVGLITSSGPQGDNIMAAEWTHMVSYKPGLVAVCIGPEKATAQNIRASKEFGVSLASADQSLVSSVSGSSSGREVDKIAALKELGFKFYAGKKIKAPMVEGASLNIECRLVQEIALGSHTMFVGEALEASTSGKPPLVMHKGQYWSMENPMEKPSADAVEKINGTVMRHAKAKV